MDPGEATLLWSNAYLPDSYANCSKYRTMTDIVTPKFHKLRSQGAIINNPMESVNYEEFDKNIKIDVDIRQCIWRCVPPQWNNNCNLKVVGTRSILGCLGTNDRFKTAPTELDLTTLKDQCITKAFSRVGNDQMLVLSSLAEANSTLQGITDLLRKAGKILSLIKKRKFWALRYELTPKDVRDLYMNARYNLRPLYHDIKALLEIYESLSKEKPKRQTARAKVSESISDNDTIVRTLFDFSGCKVDIKYDRMARRDVTVRAGVLSTASQNDASLFGLDKLVETAWDLIPFSFIVDWFINVGDTLSAWTPVLGFKTLASWVTVEETVTQKTTIVAVDFDYHAYGGTTAFAGLNQIIEKGTSHKIVTTKTRIPDYSRPIFPSFDIKLDPLKLLDLAIIGHDMGTNASYVKNG